MTRERGIQSGMFLMWGYEGEEMEDIEATVQLRAEVKSRYFSDDGLIIRSKEHRITNESWTAFVQLDP